MYRVTPVSVMGDSLEERRSTKSDNGFYGMRPLAAESRLALPSTVHAQDVAVGTSPAGANERQPRARRGKAGYVT